MTHSGENDRRGQWHQANGQYWARGKWLCKGRGTGYNNSGVPYWNLWYFVVGFLFSRQNHASYYIIVLVYMMRIEMKTN
jgi:hypothetical protein